MPSILVEDDEGHGEQEVDAQESPAKFTEKVCSTYLPMWVQEILLFGSNILIQNETTK